MFFTSPHPEISIPIPSTIAPLQCTVLVLPTSRYLRWRFFSTTFIIDRESGGEGALDRGVQLRGVLHPPRLGLQPTCRCCSPPRPRWGGDLTMTTTSFQLREGVPKPLIKDGPSIMPLWFRWQLCNSVLHCDRSAQASPLATLTGSCTTLTPSLMGSGTLIISTSSGFAKPEEKSSNAITNNSPSN